VLGDSVAFGYGVDDEVTFVRRWEQELNAKGPGRFEVVNTGHLMDDTMQEYALLRDEGMRLQPDLDLLVFVVNDIEPTRDHVEQRLLGKPPDPPKRCAIAANVELGRGLRGWRRSQPALLGCCARSRPSCRCLADRSR
jgi:hypothetical protein